MVPIDATRSRQGRKLYVYSICRNVQVHRRWHPVENVLTVKRAGGAWEIRLFDEWIRFEARSQTDVNTLVASEVGELLNPWHVGPLLDISQLGADRLEFRVTRSAGVRYDEARDVLCFKDCPDLGLCLRRWKEQFGDELSVSDLAAGDLRLELAAIRDRDADMARDADLSRLRRPLNLDPEPVVVDAAFRSHLRSIDPTEPDPWDNLHDGELSVSSSSTAELYLWWIPLKMADMRRAIFEFDTVGLDEPLEAYFKIHHTGAVAGECYLVGDGYPEGPLTTPSLYGAIENNVAGYTIGSLTEPVANTLMSPELVAAGAWASFDKLRYGLMLSSYDWPDADPGGTTVELHHSYTTSGDNAPRLELTYPGPPLSTTGTSTYTVDGC